jgi:CheY-like chemotaxis protein
MFKQCFHICNLSTSKLPWCQNICSQKELQGLKEAENAVFLLNIHLSWNGQKLSSNYGFEIANYIRTYKKSLLPIIFYSPIQKEYFEYKSKTSLKYKLLFGRGSAFLEEPFSLTQLNDTIKNIPPLSESSLHDVVTMLAAVKGVVLDRLNHNLKFGDDPLPYFDEVEPYLTEKQKSLVGFEEYRQKLIEFSQEGNESLFYDTKEAFLSICNTNLTEKGKDAPELPSQKFKILVVEDVEAELENVAGYLGKNFEVISVREAEEAIKILEQDLSNEILAVIADWRLYTDKSQTYWQKYQGYEVLEVASKTGFRALFALTSQADFVVHQIRNTLGFKFSLLKKQNVRKPEQWYLFSDVLYAGCVDALSELSEMPSSANWHKNLKGVSYKELYFQKKQSLEADAFFESVSDKADEVWNYLMRESKTEYKNIKLIRELFGLEVPKQNLNLFIVFVLRLVWLGYIYKLEKETFGKYQDEANDPYMKAFRIISKGNWRGYIAGSDVNVELNKISLTKKDVQQKKILPHERTWLIKNKIIK